MKINDKGAWVLKDPERHVVSHELASSIVELAHKINAKRAVDLGCGNGGYIKIMKRHGLECDGFDGNPHVEEITGGLGKTLDLSSPIDIGTYDMVVSLEVGEHVPEQYENIFLDNLAKSTSNYLILSWAVPGQSGTGHVNCRSNDYIIDKLESKGFVLTDDYKELRSSVTNRKFKYFRNTILTFKRETK